MPQLHVSCRLVTRATAKGYCHAGTTVRDTHHLCKGKSRLHPEAMACVLCLPQHRRLGPGSGGTVCPDILKLGLKTDCPSAKLSSVSCFKSANSAYLHISLPVLYSSGLVISCLLFFGKNKMATVRILVFPLLNCLLVRRMHLLSGFQKYGFPKAAHINFSKSLIKEK